MYNAQYPLLPPDIVFSGEDEDFNPLLEIANGGETGGERKSSLRDWNSNDPPKLLALVHEIRWGLVFIGVCLLFNLCFLLLRFFGF